MRRVSEQERQQIAADVASEFPCFGQGAASSSSNPIQEWTQDKAPMFALGVDVRRVVDYVIERLAGR